MDRQGAAQRGKPLIPTLESRERASGAKVATARRDIGADGIVSLGWIVPHFPTRLLQGVPPPAQG